LLRGRESLFHRYKNIDLFFYDVSFDIAKFKPVGRFPRQVYARFFIPKFLNSRVLYLDVDMLVFGCLSPLFNYDMSNYAIAAVEDKGFFVDRLLGRYEGYTSKYLNAGMLLIDCRSIKIKRYFDLALKLSEENAFRLADQDALNYAINGDFNSIPFKYNKIGLTISSCDLVFHFAHIKPTKLMSFFKPYREYFHIANNLNLVNKKSNIPLILLIKKCIFIFLSDFLYFLRRVI
jgi:lipopolysaccharide biosynthesis glycosyltransferase